MGYESRLYVVNRVKKSWTGDEAWAERLAVFNMCCVGWNPDKIFTEPIDFMLGRDNDGNGEPIYDDKYGKRCHMASVSTVIEAIEKLEEADHYRRFKPLLGFLKSLDESEWDDLRVVHFGY